MNDQQLPRYSRQIMPPQIDVEGQEKRLRSRVLVVGLGGLGSPIALYPTAAGIGELILADFDPVEDLTNLQHQIVHDTLSVARLKVESAAERLRALMPGSPCYRCLFPATNEVAEACSETGVA